jgi:DNA mismatch repair protein MutS2
LGVHVAVSTHLTPVKLFAFADSAYHVAAVEFDLDTLIPHYRLLYNTVGQSLGLPMARRLGLPEEICAAAESTLSPDERQLSQTITQLEEIRAALERERAVVATEREQATAARTRHQAVLAEIEANKRRLWQDELGEAKQFLRRVREEGREVVANLRVARPDARRQLAKFLHEREQEVSAKGQEVQPAAALEAGAPPQIGDEVEARDGKIRGDLIAVQGNRARIRCGSMTFEVATDQIRKAKEKRERALHVNIDSPGTTMPQLNLLGLRVHEALPRLEEFLDRAVLNHQSTVRIVHGMGTGALRRAVREFLADSPYCASYSEASRAEGGGGATVVELAS